LNERSNIIVMVDEAHRTQEGDLGRKMREALPNAFPVLRRPSKKLPSP
jgi:type I restriction enzyme R subunit